MRAAWTALGALTIGALSVASCGGTADGSAGSAGTGSGGTAAQGDGAAGSSQGGVAGSAPAAGGNGTGGIPIHCPDAAPALGDPCTGYGSCDYWMQADCNTGCSGFVQRSFGCELGEWAAQGHGEPTCVCDQDCSVEALDTWGSPDNPDDRCSLESRCGDFVFSVECDAENDGTETSVCACIQAGSRTPLDDLVQGEAPDSCLSAAGQCADILTQ